MLWLVIIIISYFISAVVYLIDKYLLGESIFSPRILSFYIGILGISSVFLIPFTGFYIPSNWQIILSLLSGGFLVYGTFWFYKGLQLLETSRIVPAVGGLSPLFSFVLIYLFSSGQKTLSFYENIAFILLIFGSVLINLPLHIFSLEEVKNIKGLFLSKSISNRSNFFKKSSIGIKYSTITAFLFSLSFVLAKYVYLGQSFWNGFIWMRIGGFLTAVIFFLLFSDTRNDIFKLKINFKKSAIIIFLLAQVFSAVAAILQNWAISLASLIYVPVINALQGVQYIFLFIFTVILSLKFPKILKEEISKKIIFQKIIAMFLVIAGILVLIFV